jgi:hypothetical protein
MNIQDLCAGVARRNITPETSIWISGYPYRDRPSEGAVHPLWAKAKSWSARVTTGTVGVPIFSTEIQWLIVAGVQPL